LLSKKREGEAEEAARVAEAKRREEEEERASVRVEGGVELGVLTAALADYNDEGWVGNTLKFAKERKVRGGVGEAGVCGLRWFLEGVSH
jgi:hypothetical protein